LSGRTVSCPHAFARDGRQALASAGAAGYFAAHNSAADIRQHMDTHHVVDNEVIRQAKIELAATCRWAA
jgi:hypothetical protein